MVRPLRKAFALKGWFWYYFRKFHAALAFGDNLKECRAWMEPLGRNHEHN